MIRRHVLLIQIALLASCSATEREAFDEAREGSSLVRITMDVVYGHKFGLAMTFDVYQPREPNGAAVILINSGGWYSPVMVFHTLTDNGARLFSDAELDQVDRRLRQFSPRLLLESGFTIFNVRHGSTPKLKLPKIVADLRRAIRFIRDRAPDYRVDPERIGLWGGSAGGQLALLLGTTAEIGIEDASDDLELTEGRVAAVVAYFPVTDLQRWVRAAPERVEHYPAIALTPDQHQELSPIHFASLDDPPTLIIHGDQDAVAPIVEGESMYQALLRSQVTSEFITVEGAEHGFVGENADLALAETVDWFREHLGEQ